MNSTKIFLLISVIAVAAIIYFNYASSPNVDTFPNETVETTNDTIPTPQDDIELAEGEELPVDLAVYAGWEQVDGEGYYFMHPGYFIKEENGHHIMAYEPLLGNEFSGLAIRQPFETEDIMAYMDQTISDTDASVGANVTIEPQKVSIEGTSEAYMYEYEVESGPNTGINKFYALKSPATGMWVTIQYPAHETAENIRKSFNFID